MHQRLAQQYELAYVPSQWFSYFDGERTRHCQPDGILVLEKYSTVVIVEVKYSHTAEAFWQLEHLYVPVLREYLRDASWRIVTCEVVKWFDPSTVFPVRPVLRERFEDIKVGEFAVHILNR